MIKESIICRAFENEVYKASKAEASIENVSKVLNNESGQEGVISGNSEFPFGSSMPWDGYSADRYDRKLCPLKGATSPVLAFCNIDAQEDIEKNLGVKCLAIRDKTKEPSVEYIGGYCDGPRCAWYDGRKDNCAVLSIARGNGK